MQASSLSGTTAAAPSLRPHRFRIGRVLRAGPRFAWRTLWIISLLLLAGAISAWIISYRHGTCVGVTRMQFADDSTITIAFTSGRGELAMGYSRAVYRPPSSDAADGLPDEVPGTAISRVRYEWIHYHYAKPMNLQEMLDAYGVPVPPSMSYAYAITTPVPPSVQPTVFNRAGFGGKTVWAQPATDGLPDSHKIHRVDVTPYWFLMAACIPVPLLRLRRALRQGRRSRRLRRGLCPQCAYDMRASPGKCSECGYTAPI